MAKSITQKVNDFMTNWKIAIIGFFAVIGYAINMINPGFLYTIFFNSDVNNKKNIENSRRICTPLYEHDLLISLQNYQFEALNTTWINEYKTAVGRDILIISYSSAEKYYREYAKWLENNPTTTHGEAYSKLINTVSEIMIESRSRWRDAGIHPIIIEKVERYQSDKVLRLSQQIKNEFLNKNENVITCASYAFISIRSVYDQSFIDSRKLINEVNGELEGDVYKGKINDAVHIIYGGY